MLSAQRPLLSPEGGTALAALLRLRPLMAFDFDGTLAPIVDRADAAQTPGAVAQRLQQLAARLPVAVVSGRAAADVRRRLGFVPRDVIGSHGADDETDAAGTRSRSAALSVLRQALAARAAALSAAGVAVDDKGASIALHYRMAADPVRALALIDELLQPGSAPWRVFGGKMVVNAVAAGAPDKAQAVRSLVARCGAGAAFFAGDDINDEPVFEAADDDWITVRVGCDGPPSRARWYIDGTAQMAPLIDLVLGLLDAPG